MSTRVPAEFLGLGRRFRERIADADDQAVGVMTSIFTPLATRAERSLRPRPERLQDAARHWRQRMPPFGLLDSKTELSRRELHIREVRMGVGTWLYGPRDERTGEAGVVILLVEFWVAPALCQLMMDTAALLPMHTLGRWYQRTLDNSETALISDLGRLAAAYGKILDKTAASNHPNFVCPSPNGQWAGSVTRHFSEATQRPERVLNVRTFLAETAVPRSVS